MLYVYENKKFTRVYDAWPVVGDTSIGESGKIDEGLWEQIGGYRDVVDPRGV